MITAVTSKENWQFKQNNENTSCIWVQNVYWKCMLWVFLVDYRSPSENTSIEYRFKEFWRADNYSNATDKWANWTIIECLESCLFFVGLI